MRPAAIKCRNCFNRCARIDSTVTRSSTSGLADPGEFGIISQIAAGIASNDTVVTGIGDDAAVTAVSPGMQLLTSTDMLLEDVHFRSAWHEPYLLGRKSLAVSISDIAAMGGIPRWSLLSLALPTDISTGFVSQFIRGFHSMAADNGVVLIGGDTCSSRSGVAVSVTIIGEQYPELIVRRSGAKPDDDIWVTGSLGDSALVLEKLEKGDSVPGGLLCSLLDPVPQVSAALALAGAGLVTAMIDISDGILADFGHIAEQSGVGGLIRIHDLPLSAGFHSLARNFPATPYHMALAGGEDYQLCFTANSSMRKNIDSCMENCGIAVTRVGIVTSCRDVVAVNPDGSHYIMKSEGFNHFR